MDFTVKKYTELLKTLQKAGYQAISFETFCNGKGTLSGKFVILRHDVDLKAENSLTTAKIEHKLSMQASYYFRIVPQSNKPDIIRAIADMGHEIGYHYEDMTLCDGDAGKAIRHFNRQLEYFRTFYPVKTICMHGSPRSKHDGKDLWKTYDYHDYGIIGEPYFDVDFDKTFYITDTGRRWDGAKFSVRDKVETTFTQSYRTTDQIMEAVKNGTFPPQVMMTTHPQRWNSGFLAWLKELSVQNAKNVVKYFLIRKR